MQTRKIVVVFGTRPEAIKLAPVIKSLQDAAPAIETKIILTAQHREMVTPILEFFQIAPDYDLDIMKRRQQPNDVTIRVLRNIKMIYAREKPACVLVQGDTTSAMAAALGAFYRQIPVAHVEAGLRTGDRYNPFPEEMNRRLITRLATLHFAATDANQSNLLKENVAPESIYITGNPVIDALQQILKSEHKTKSLPAELRHIDWKKRQILLTTHRRENFGEPQKNIFAAVAALLGLFADVEFIFPVHPNPEVQKAVKKYLPFDKRIHLISPLDYINFIRVMELSHLVLTDSGGIQEEAPALGKPVLILRKTTERNELVESGNGILVGVEKGSIVKAAGDLLSDRTLFERMSRPAFPFGSGGAAAKIAEILQKKI